MEIIINTSMIICFLFSFFFLICKITGHYLFRLIYKLMSLIGVLFPIIYLLKKLDII